MGRLPLCALGSTSLPSGWESAAHHTCAVPGHTSAADTPVFLVDLDLDLHLDLEAPEVLQGCYAALFCYDKLSHAADKQHQCSLSQSRGEGKMHRVVDLVPWQDVLCPLLARAACLPYPLVR